MAAPYTLYGYAGAGSAAVEAALEWTGAPMRVVAAASWAPESALAELERVNPLKQIPTLLLPDGSVMTESAAILIHLGLVFPESGLLPSDPSRRARALRGLVYIAANCYSAVGVSDFPERWTDQPDEAAIGSVRRAARAQLHRHWDLFADQFHIQPYLGGSAPDALDLLAAVVSKWSGTRAHLKGSRPSFLDTLLRIEAHEKIAPVFARHWKS